MKHEDILYLPHPVSRKYPHMSDHDRAAQFAPFAALVGYEDRVRETARKVEKKIELSEEEKTMLDERMQILREHLREEPLVELNYFVPDTSKDGGSYRIYRGNLKKIDDYYEIFVFAEGFKVAIDDIFSIESELFSSLESYL